MTERERLIELLNKKQDVGIVYNESQMDSRCSESKEISNDELANYLIENGVIVPPIKVGDPVFRICTWDGKHVVEGKISMIKQKSDLSWKFRGIGRYFEGSCDYTIVDIGTTIFLTREDAEKAISGEK